MKKQIFKIIFTIVIVLSVTGWVLYPSYAFEETTYMYFIYAGSLLCIIIAEVMKMHKFFWLFSIVALLTLAVPLIWCPIYSTSIEYWMQKGLIVFASQLGWLSYIFYFAIIAGTMSISTVISDMIQERKEKTVV